MIRSGVLIATLLISAACGGGSPEEPAPGTAVPAPAPAKQATVIAEWSRADIEDDASRIGYGKKPAAILERAEGALIFRPETPSDHVALPFVDLPVSGAERPIELVTTVDMEANGCVATLQDQGYTDLVSVPCNDVGDHRGSARVSERVRSVRVYFKLSGPATTRIPARIQVVEYR